MTDNTNEALPPLPAPFGYVSDGAPNGLLFQHQQWSLSHCLIHNVAPVYSHAQISVIRAEAYAAGCASIAMGEGEPVPLNIIRYWPDGFADDLEKMWLDLVGFIPNYKLHDLQRLLAKHGFTMVLYEGAPPTAQPAPAAPVSDERLSIALAALDQVANWDLPRVPDSRSDEPGATISYAHAYGSKGEEDYMRRLAATAAQRVRALRQAPAQPMSEDSKRLDWMATNEAHIGWNREGDACQVWAVQDEEKGVEPLTEWHNSAREAIDAARGITAQAGEAK